MSTVNHRNEMLSGLSMSWAAIFSGLFTSTGIGALFSLLGMGIGLALFKPESDVINNLSILGVTWVILGGTAAMFIGGIVTGYAIPSSNKCRGIMHGLVMWSLSLVLGLMLTATGVGSVLTGSGQLIGKAIDVSTQVASSAMKPMVDSFSNQLNLSENKSLARMAKQAGKLVTQAAKKAINQQAGVNAGLSSVEAKQEKLIESIQAFMLNTNDAVAQTLYDEAIKQLTQNTNLNRQQAEQMLNQWQEAYQEAADKLQEKADQFTAKAKDVANSTASVLSSIALYAFFTMVLGLAASLVGSWLGTKWDHDRR